MLGQEYIQPQFLFLLFQHANHRIGAADYPDSGFDPVFLRLGELVKVGEDTEFHLAHLFALQVARLLTGYGAQYELHTKIKDNLPLNAG